MKGILFHQVLTSILNLLLPYLLLSFGQDEWHQEYSKLAAYLLLARNLMYNSYTSIFTESSIKTVDNPRVKYGVVIFILLILVIISEGYLLNGYLLFLTVGVLFYEDIRRKELFYANAIFKINLVSICSVLLMFLAGYSILWLLPLTILMLMVSIGNLTFSSGEILSISSVWQRRSYIATALFSFAVGGGYIEYSAKTLTTTEFTDLRYALLLLAPISFLAQLIEYLWFSNVLSVSRRYLILMFVMMSAISILSMAVILSMWFGTEGFLILTLAGIALLTSLNVILRLILRDFNNYSYLFKVVLAGSIPFTLLKIVKPDSAIDIYVIMLLAMLLMFVLAIFRVINHLRENNWMFISDNKL